jgi:hypothetical protein
MTGRASELQGVAVGAVGRDAEDERSRAVSDGMGRRVQADFFELSFLHGCRFEVVRDPGPVLTIRGEPWPS